MRDLSGSTALVTGASRGIGAAIARALAARGVTVVLTARSEEALAKVSHEIAESGGRVLAIPGDVTDPSTQEQLVSRTLRELGHIDLLINNAAVVIASAYEQLEPEEIERVIALNLGAPMLLTRRVLPSMLARARGHIVNIASLGGLIGVGWAETYGATKHALVGFTRSLRASLAERGAKVGVSVCCPGFVEEVGMYADEVVSRGNRAPWALGTSSVHSVTAAVLRAIEHDLPEVVVSPRPIRLLLALAALSPRLGAWMIRRTGGHRVFELIAAAQEREPEV